MAIYVKGDLHENGRKNLLVYKKGKSVHIVEDNEQAPAVEFRLEAKSPESLDGSFPSRFIWVALLLGWEAMYQDGSLRSAREAREFIEDNLDLIPGLA